MRTRLQRIAAVLCAATLTLAGCSGDDEIRSGSLGGDSTASNDPEDPSDPPSQDDPAEIDEVEAPFPEDLTPSPDLDQAENATRKDSYYPINGDPVVDTIHHGLGLSWTPSTQTLRGNQIIDFRATRPAKRFTLDMAPELEISALTLDGEDVDYEHDSDNLVVTAPLTGDISYTLEISYSGTPAPVPAPVERSDFSSTGFTITDDDEVWTMQEPFGAYTWYAVNDQPSDKALYDFTLAVPEPWTGVANGDLVDTTTADGITTTTWHLAEPAASYLTTLAFGDYDLIEQTGPRGIPIRLFIPSDDPELSAGPEYSAEALTWLEDKLGPYPFDTAGIVVVDSESGMETQTMITLGDTEYALSKAVVIHEFAHQWYGDTVTPNDWRDVWMNEGMAMYLQGMWEAEDQGITIEEKMDEYALYEGLERANAGPPADYDPTKFGSSNIYVGPALMWHELRKKLGDDEFFRILREWPAAQENKSVGRDQYFAWIEKQTGEELTAFFDAWLLGEKTPERS